MTIVMSEKITEPPVKQMPEVRWVVSVARASIQNSWEWVAKCDTKDEAIELSDSLDKRYFVRLESVEK